MFYFTVFYRFRPYDRAAALSRMQRAGTYARSSVHSLLSPPLLLHHSSIVSLLFYSFMPYSLFYLFFSPTLSCLLTPYVLFFLSLSPFLFSFLSLSTSNSLSPFYAYTYSHHIYYLNALIFQNLTSNNYRS